MGYGVRVGVEELCLKIVWADPWCLPGGMGVRVGGGGMCAVLQSSVQGCDYHLGRSKLALDVIWSPHCTNGKIEVWGSACLRSHNHKKKSVSNLGFFGLFKGCQDRQIESAGVERGNGTRKAAAKNRSEGEMDKSTQEGGHYAFVGKSF